MWRLRWTATGLRGIKRITASSASDVNLRRLAALWSSSLPWLHSALQSFNPLFCYSTLPSVLYSTLQFFTPPISPLHYPSVLYSTLNSLLYSTFQYFTPLFTSGVSTKTDKLSLVERFSLAFYNTKTTRSKFLKLFHG